MILGDIFKTCDCIGYYVLDSTGWEKKNGHPFHTEFKLFLIILGKSDEKMPYWLGLGDSFAILNIDVPYLV